MRKASFHILRVGVGITFVWIGILILKQPDAFGGYIQPWALKILPLSVTQAMQATAFLDIVIGVLLLVDWLTWLAAIIAAAHLAVVLTVSGITDITVRDIGLLAGTIALAIDSLPNSILKMMKEKKTQRSS